MTLDQSLSIAVITMMMALFVWGRLRYDVVAALALLAALAVGLVPAKDAFKGFSDDIVIIVGSALVVSAAVARSGIIERALSHVAPYVRSTQMQISLLVFSVAVMSAIIKNIGALAMMLPIAYQLARKGGKSPSIFLMPMAFASLLGGIVTLVGTSPNIIVARVREELTGRPFEMFDFAPVGLGLALAGCLFLCVGYRLLPRDRQGAASLEQALDISDYVTEVQVPQRPARPSPSSRPLRRARSMSSPSCAPRRGCPPPSRMQACVPAISCCYAASPRRSSAWSRRAASNSMPTSARPIARARSIRSR
ncbi:hypothetical protein BIWAKO_03674 [Bosea sp. BIWAKO-01]|nr:hypothetical protein BIWAKO_03674 [Bosea sp. BIWAKO-01]